MCNVACPLCKQSTLHRQDEGADRIHYNCVRCGNFSAALDVIDELGQASDTYLLSGMTRDRSDHSQTLHINKDNHGSLKGMAPVSVIERQNRLLQVIQ